MKRAFIICAFFLLVVGINALESAVVDSLLMSNFVDTYSQAHAEYSRENYQKALELFLQVWQSKKQDPDLLYEIACCYGMLNNTEMAGKFLLEAVNAGFRDFEHFLRDTDFDQVRDDEAFIANSEKIHNFFNATGEISYVEVPSMLRYRTVLPKDFDPKKEYYLLIGLHGFGHHPLDYATWSRIFEDFGDIIFVAPQATFPFEIGFSKQTAFSWVVIDSDVKNDATLSVNYIKTLTTELKKKYKIKKTFLSGFSQGGNFTLNVGIKNYKLFDGLICIGGWLNEEFVTTKEINAAKKTPVVIVHGKNDTVVNYTSGTMAYETLQKAGYDVKLIDFEGAHIVPRVEFVEAVEWLRGK